MVYIITVVEWNQVLVRILLMLFMIYITHPLLLCIKPGQYELLASPGTTFNNSRKDISIKRMVNGLF